ncbi:MAG: copper resistance protein NlpE N-terminal domain-containing protein [Bacteroidales bacterium]|nr:copper resistance protein NlpE N-terminal domain-containing protein [Bacteroidales bacterium]
MKKLFFLLVAAATMMSCQQKAGDATTMANDSTATAAATDTLVFEGTVPAADGPGIQYQFTLNPDSSYTLVETYLEAENGKDMTQNYTGKAEAVAVGAEKGLKVALGEGAGFLYLKQVGDSTFRLVNDSLQEAASGLNYDLKLK